jgi:IS605 OrfB family transposase
MEMTKQIFSRRISKNQLDHTTVVSIQETLRFFNDAKIKTYKYLYEKEINKINKFGTFSEHLFIKNKYNVDDYYTNSIVRSSNGILKSQKETHKLNKQNLENKIQTAQKKLKNLEKQIKNKQKILDSIIDFTKGKKKKISFYKGANEAQKKILFIVRLKKRTLIFYNLYNFEHKYLKPEIKKLINRTDRIKERIHRMEIKLEKLEKGFKGATFGGKKLFKNQFTIPHFVRNHERWKKDFETKKYFSFEVSGRKDAKYGNFEFKYIPDTKTLHFQDHKGKPIVIDNLEFPYGQSWLNEAIDYQINLNTEDRKKFGKPISWKIEDHVKYYIFKATVIFPSKENINYSKADGVISFDKNYDHIAWTEVNKEGNLIDSGIIYFNLDGKSNGQTNKILEKAAIKFVQIAVGKNKPLVGEEIDITESKSKLAYGNKKRNKKITQFAYNKMDASIASRAHKEGVALFKVNPAYTSQIGKIKYMKQKGLSIHVSAAYVIGRRALRKKERLPFELKEFLSEKIIQKHHWSHWSFISKTLKEVRPKFFYTSFDKEMKLLTCKSLKEYKEVLES